MHAGQVLEVVLRGARLIWPWWADLGWALDLAHTYSRYFLVPWVSPNPLVRAWPRYLIRHA